MLNIYFFLNIFKDKDDFSSAYLTGGAGWLPWWNRAWNTKAFSGNLLVDKKKETKNKNQKEQKNGEKCAASLTRPMVQRCLDNQIRGLTATGP